MINIGWLDPSMDSKNTGDQIISDAVLTELTSRFPGIQLLRLPTQRRPSKRELDEARDVNVFLLGGTNIINGNIPRYHQWHMSPRAYTKFRRRTSLLGVGWWQYQPTVNTLSRRIWRDILDGQVHSVRDEYTAGKFSSIGIPSLYTGCITMWALSGKRMQFGQRKSSVIATITDYNKDKARDTRLFSELRRRYERVYLWPQGAGDAAYVRSIADDIHLLDPSLDEFNAALDSNQFDYIGTRLHAGIRALQRGISSYIVAVDNRATEMARGTGLPVISGRLDPSDWALVDDRRPIKIILPDEAIDEWTLKFGQRLEATARS